MAMLKHCFFCKRDLVIPSGQEAFKLTDYDFENIDVFEKYKLEDPYILIGEYCCKPCFECEILSKILL